MQQAQILPVKAKILEASALQAQPYLDQVLNSYEVAQIKQLIRTLNAAPMHAERTDRTDVSIPASVQTNLQAQTTLH